MNLVSRRRKYPPFPNETWKTVADVPIDQPVIDGGVLKQSLYMFYNEGADYWNAGNPTFLVNQMRPSIDPVTFLCVCKANDLSTIGYPLAQRDEGSGGKIYFLQSSANLQIGWGGQTVNIPIPDTNWHAYMIKVTASGDYYAYRDGVAQSNGTLTGLVNLTPTTDLFFGGRTSGTAANWEGSTSCFTFFHGVGDIDSPSLSGLTFLDSYRFYEWDGGVTMTSVAGNVATLTAGLPFTERQKTLLPVSMKC